jgi:hypothetical protein
MDIKIGDRITFRAVTRFTGAEVTRKVRGFWHSGKPTVKYQGHADFIVDWCEISFHNGDPVNFCSKDYCRYGNVRPATGCSYACDVGKEARKKSRHVLECDVCGSTSVRVECWARMDHDGCFGLAGDLESQDTAWCLDCDDYIGFSYTRKIVEVPA